MNRLVVKSLSKIINNFDKILSTLRCSQEMIKNNVYIKLLHISLMLCKELNNTKKKPLDYVKTMVVKCNRVFKVSPQEIYTLNLFFYVHIVFLLFLLLNKNVRFAKKFRKLLYCFILKNNLIRFEICLNFISTIIRRRVVVNKINRR